jgi:hypothetical protein
MRTPPAELDFDHTQPSGPILGGRAQVGDRINDTCEGQQWQGAVQFCSADTAIVLVEWIAGPARYKVGDQIRFVW